MVTYRKELTGGRKAGKKDRKTERWKKETEGERKKKRS